jgi:hypothetical protein
MAYRILILLFSLTAFAEDSINKADPNLYRKDGAMTYDDVYKQKDIDTTTGALLIDKKTVPMPAEKKPKKKKNSPPEASPKAGATEDPKSAVPSSNPEEQKPAELPK